MSDYSPISAAPIQWNRAATSRSADQACNFLFLELKESEQRQRALRQADRERLQATIAALTLELYAASFENDSSWRRYSRAKNDYGERNRYRQSPVTHSTACKVADWLQDSGYAEGSLGHYKRYPGFGNGIGAGKQSRIRASKKLIDHFGVAFGVRQHDIGYADWVETIVLREGRQDSKTNREIDYEDTRETRRMRENLRRLNSFLSGFRISLAKEAEGIVDLPPFLLRRIFSRGSFELGGRFYGGPWGNLPSEDRVALLIDGEEVVELDFSSYHPRLIYQLEGIPLSSSVDPYEVTGWTEEGNREWCKTAFQQLINAEEGSTIRKPPQIPAVKIGKGGWQNLIGDLSEHHRNIEKWFRSGRGLKLQRLDSDIAEVVLLTLADQGVCCLSIHDNFIVPASQEDLLHQAMTKAYKEVVSEKVCVLSDPVIHSR